MNQSKKPKLIVLLGPTAAGKSSLGLELAEKFSGEIISADSRQIYKGLDIISGKLKYEDMKAIPHYLIDILEPWEDFSVTDFKSRAEPLIVDITNRQKTPFLVGGTGLYIESLVHNYSLENPAPNLALRQKLELKTAPQLVLTLKALQKDLVLKPDDLNNKHRLIRKIELSMSGTVKTTNRGPSQYNILQIGLQVDRSDLKELIHTRVEQRLEMGAVSEVEHLLELISSQFDQNFARKKITSFGLGYSVIMKFIEGEMSQEQMIAKFITAEYQYAKRQMTWFARDKTIQWVKKDSKTVTTVDSLIQDFLGLNTS